MASTGVIFQKALSQPLYSASFCKSRTVALSSQFLSCNSLSKLKKRTLYSATDIRQFKNSRGPIIRAAQFNFLRVIQTALKVGKDGIEAGTSLVPEAIPRPIARFAVAIAAVTVALFILKAFISTVFFALAVMGLSYFAFIALNKDEGPKTGGGTGTTSVEDSLEEARKIMDKYK